MTDGNVKGFLRRNGVQTSGETGKDGDLGALVVVGPDDGPIEVTSNGGGGGTGLTDTELRATPVPVSGTVGVTEPVSVDDNGGSLTVDGPLTNTELRAASVPVVHVGTVSVAEPLSVDDNGSTLSVDDGGASLTVDGTVTATGPLTDTQLRATAVPVSGTVTASGPLTDTQLRATAVPVSGTVTVNAIPAGSNNIGDVDVLTVPADPFGANADAAVAAAAAGSIQAKLRRLTTDIDAIKTSVAAATPAGTNNIGDVDLASAIPAGTNNIGDVDVLTLPAIPAGNNNIGDVDLASAIPAGTNNIGDVDVLTLPSIPAGTNNIGDVDVLTMPRPSTSAVAQVASSATSVTLQASNANRLGLSIFNDSTQVLYMKFGTTASTTSYTLKMAAGSYYELPPNGYTGRIDGIWASANGNAYVTELS